MSKSEEEIRHAIYMTIIDNDSWCICDKDSCQKSKNFDNALDDLTDLTLNYGREAVLEYRFNHMSDEGLNRLIADMRSEEKRRATLTQQKDTDE